MSTPLRRRSFLAQVAGGAVVALAGAAAAQTRPTRPRVTDQDPNLDPANHGRGARLSRPSSVTDLDSGPQADRRNHGRGDLLRTGPDDGDPCPITDRTGRGPCTPRPPGGPKRHR